MWILTLVINNLHGVYVSLHGVKNKQNLKKLWGTGIYHTTESISAVCITPPSQSPESASHCRVKLHTTESKSKSKLFNDCY